MKLKLETLTDGLIMAWGIAYLAASLLRPGILKSAFGYEISTPHSTLVMLIVGFLMLVAIIFKLWPLLLGLGVFEAFGMVFSWTGMMVWRTPLSYSAAQISMAVLDFLMAAVLFYKSYEVYAGVKG